MKTFLLLLLVPALAFSAKGASLPVPKDPRGRSPALTDAMVMDDGTWVVSDTAGRVWWSRDLGGRWDSVATSATGARGELFGASVFATDEKSVWTYDAGWRSTVIPAECTKGTERNTSSDGVMGVYDPDGKKVTYCRSIDGLRTWTIWFSPPNATLPQDTAKWLGEEWDGKIWFNISDSGYTRGTSDGLAWTRIDLPPMMTSFDFVPLTERGRELVVMGGSSRRSQMSVASSQDMGKTWSIHSLAEPGWAVRKMAEHLFFTFTFDSLEGRNYGVGPSQAGPWTMMDTAFRGNLIHGDDAYVVEEHAIYKLVLDGVGLLPKPVVSAWRVRMENGRRVVELPAALAGTPWCFRSLDGRKLASGRAAGERLELPLAGGGLLSVGSQVRMVPGL